MDLPEEDALTRDEWALLRLAHLYARALMWNKPALLQSAFTEDGTLERPGQPPLSREGLSDLPGRLKASFISTIQSVINQDMMITGDVAEGETIGLITNIMTGPAGTHQAMTRSVRYLDRCVRQRGVWKFRRRVILIETTDVRQINLGGVSTVVAGN